jgi:hypothetical protein
MEELNALLLTLQEPNYVKSGISEWAAQKCVNLIKSTVGGFFNLTPAQMVLLQRYKFIASRQDIRICYSITEAADTCTGTYCIVFIKEINIYIMTRNKDEYDFIMANEISIYNAAELELPEFCLQVIFGEYSHHPVFVYHSTTHAEELSKRLSEFFRCEVVESVSENRRLYTVNKQYESIRACFDEISKFTMHNPAFQPIWNELAKDEKHEQAGRRIDYCIYPIPRYGRGKTTYYINSHVGNVEININVKNKIINKSAPDYASVDKITEWIQRNPPKNIVRKDYYNMCAAALKRVHPRTFSDIMQKNYRVARIGGQRYWVPK